ncbi:MAG: 5-formyltetrahydrofolate cyclo-ligase [Nannocystaceae bacterium]
MASPTKIELRAEVLARRAALAPEVIAARSAALTRRLLELPAWRRARRVAAFVGVGGEPDTAAILAATLGAGKRLLLPRVVRRPPEGGRSRLGFRWLGDLGALEPGRFGLLEPPAVGPEAATLVPALAVDLVLVPGLAFARGGGRLGFGMGYYDRALAPLAGAAAPLRVGICFAEFVGAAVPTEAHDVPMHALLSERELVDCGRGATLS